MANTANKRTTFQLEKDRNETTTLYLEGKTQEFIAEIMGVSRTQITYDLKVIQKRWREQTTVDLDESKAIELARIDNLERVSWMAWERSKEDKETTFTKRGEKGDREASIRREGQSGNPAFLDRISWCIDRRCKLLGLDAPVKLDARLLQFTIDFTTPGGPIGPGGSHNNNGAEALVPGDTAA